MISENKSAPKIPVGGKLKPIALRRAPTLERHGRGLAPATTRFGVHSAAHQIVDARHKAGHDS